MNQANRCMVDGDPPQPPFHAAVTIRASSPKNLDEPAPVASQARQRRGWAKNCSGISASTSPSQAGPRREAPGRMVHLAFCVVMAPVR
jgi:hypothetical protein